MVPFPARKIKHEWCRWTDSACHTIFEPQNIIKCIAVRSLSNKEMPLHGSQVKANKRKDCIIWARFHLEEPQKKCGVNATKEVPLVTISSKEFHNKRTHMILVLP